VCIVLLLSSLVAVHGASSHLLRGRLSLSQRDGAGAVLDASADQKPMQSEYKRSCIHECDVGFSSDQDMCRLNPDANKCYNTNMDRRAACVKRCDAPPPPPQRPLSSYPAMQAKIAAPVAPKPKVYDQSCNGQYAKCMEVDKRGQSTCNYVKKKCQDDEAFHQRVQTQKAASAARPWWQKAKDAIMGKPTYAPH